MTGHYLTTVPEGCRCYFTEQRIPGEPHIPSFLDAEPNLDCPVHFTDLDRANDVISLLMQLVLSGSVQGADELDHCLEASSEGDGWNEPESETYTCTCEEWEGIGWVQIDPARTGRPDPMEVVRQWRLHVWPERTNS